MDVRDPSRTERPAVRLALRYDPRPAPAGGDVATLYESLLDHAAAAEALGVDLVWVSERPFVPGARVPAALPVCAGLAARTERIRIGVGPLALPLYHPLRVAEDAATLDGLSGGRLELALGLGGVGLAFLGFGVERRDRGERLEEGVALLRAAFTGGEIAFAGRHHSVSGVAVSPVPVQAPGPPLWVGAGAAAAVRRAARVGAGLLATGVAPIHEFLEARQLAGAADQARAALEYDAGSALSREGRRSLGRWLGEVRGLGGFDLVIGAESSSGGGWLGPAELEALLDLRRELARAAEGA